VTRTAATSVSYNDTSAHSSLPGVVGPGATAGGGLHLWSDRRGKKNDCAVARIGAEGISMEVAVIGAGFIGGILGRALADAGHEVTFGSRNSENREVLGDTDATIAPVGDALARADVVVLALPGAAVPELTRLHGDALVGKLVIDATNQMGQPVANSRASLPSSVRYARAFNTLGGENMADPLFADGPADLFFSAPEADRETTETLIDGVGLRPVYVGENQEVIIDALFQLWIALAITQHHGRRLALRLLHG
jgi:predicted dinucleotide-binding enzyme